jgi:hypothetical protein
MRHILPFREPPGLTWGLAAHGLNAGSPDDYESDTAKLLADAKDWQLVLQIGGDQALAKH